jgi:hypothetical protein
MEHLSFWWTFLAALFWSCHNVSVMEVQRGRTGLRESHQYSERFNIWSQIKLGKRRRASEACRWLANGPMGHGLGPGMGNFNKRHFRPQNSGHARNQSLHSPGYWNYVPYRIYLHLRKVWMVCFRVLVHMSRLYTLCAKGKACLL